MKISLQYVEVWFFGKSEGRRYFSLVKRYKMFINKIQVIYYKYYIIINVFYEKKKKLELIKEKYIK